MDRAPLRMESYDISHIQGTNVVGSMVVFEDGAPRKSDYRHYAIREAAGDGRSDDVASIAEVTRRRFHRHLRDTQQPGDLITVSDVAAGAAPTMSVSVGTKLPELSIYGDPTFIVSTAIAESSLTVPGVRLTTRITADGSHWWDYWQSTFKESWAKTFRPAFF